MGNTREWTTKFNARFEELEHFVKARAGRSQKRRRAAKQNAANGRPSDLAAQARTDLALRRIAGPIASVKAKEGKRS